MTKKELYRLSVEVSGAALRHYFDTNVDGFKNMELNIQRQNARKKVYELLAPLLLTEQKSVEVSKTPQDDHNK